jgi:uncharacterized membrane protein HdeD (DUF308 family)
MGPGLSRHWWAVGLRSLVAILFGVGILLLPPHTIASLVLLFTAYVAADGVFTILAAVRAARRGQRWWTMILEGTTNLAVAGIVLIWSALAVVPLVPLAGAWAVATGALMLAAARRLVGAHGGWLLALAGALSAAWGVLVSTVGPSSADDPRLLAWWLVAYAFPFGLLLLAVALRLRRRQQEEGLPPD